MKAMINKHSFRWISQYPYFILSHTHDSLIAAFSPTSVMKTLFSPVSYSQRFSGLRTIIACLPWAPTTANHSCLSLMP